MTKDSLQEFLNYKLIELDQYTISVHDIVNIFFIVIFTKIIILIIKNTLLKMNRIREESDDNIYTIIKIISYFIWVISISSILSLIGMKLTALLTGSAALLVGVGIGLQQTFNDFISGIILIFEGKTKINDILEVDGKILQLTDIGIRTTECIDRDGIAVIIPNSKVVTDKVINWTHQEERKIRFRINIGIAYGSDVELTIKTLENCAKGHPKVTDKDKVEARFVDFGNSALNFELLFFCEELFRIERVKSDIRRSINTKLAENNITIPFPQIDVHLKNEIS
jgi:small-conductance mechanosensitive channel